MKPFNRYEIFKTVWLGAKRDGFERAVNDFGTCAYRSGDHKCAIGQAIPDEEYFSGLEGSSGPEVLQHLGYDLYGPNERTFDSNRLFIKHLQMAHDRATGAEEYEAMLRAIAFFETISIDHIDAGGDGDQ